MDKQIIALPINLGETVFTVETNDDYTHEVVEHRVNAYLVREGCGYSENINLSAAGFVDDEGRFHEFDGFGLGVDIGDWRGAFINRDKAQELADDLNVKNADFRKRMLAKR